MADTKRIVILGGTRGLGKALARDFLGRGARVFITGTSGQSLGQALSELSPPGGGRGDDGPSLDGTVLDLLCPQDLPRVAAEAEASLGGVDHWINNAGINQEPARLLDLDDANCEKVLRVDLLGAPLCGPCRGSPPRAVRRLALVYGRPWLGRPLYRWTLPLWLLQAGPGLSLEGPGEGGRRSTVQGGGP